ncbi:MAG: glycosyltransferase, partial [bacterium]|nr:glycosyltransferase [bacterium]
GIEVKFFNKMQDFYDQIDVLVLTSKFDYMPIVVIDALNNGIPVVASPVGDLAILNIKGVYLANKDEEFIEKIIEIYKEKPKIEIPYEFKPEFFYEKWREVINEVEKPTATILCISGIGDFLEALPYLYSLNKLYKTHFIISQKLLEICNFFKFNVITSIRSKSGKLKTLDLIKILNLTLRNHDLFINIKETNHPLIMRLLIKYYCAKKSLGFEEFYDINIKEYKSMKISQAYKDLFEKLGIKPDYSFVEKIDEIDDFKDKVVIFIGGDRKTKKYPIELWRKITQRLECIIIGSIEELEDSKKIETDKTINLTGKLNILDTLRLIKSSNVVITNDSFAMHAAYIFKKKFIVIMPATEERMFPGEGVILKKPYPCSPCYYYDCPKTPYKGCHYQITPEEVIEALDCLKN